MSIYNFIYCFFYKFWEKRGSDGRLTGSIHVLCALLIQLLLVREIVRSITGSIIYKLPNYGEYGTNKTIYLLWCIPMTICCFLFYNKNRTKRLLKKYYIEYKDNKKNTIRILCYFVLPILVLIALGVIRQRF
ncbi:hypothetical protein ABH942_001700 [Flavobacterium sp. 28YEA47A]